MTQELKACPFCGGKAYLGTIRHSHPPYDNEELKNQLEYYHINCATCAVGAKAIAGYLTEAEAIAAWNTRTPDPLVAELVEALEAAVPEIDVMAGWVHDETISGRYLEIAARARAILAKAKAKGDGHVG